MVYNRKTCGMCESYSGDDRGFCRERVVKTLLAWQFLKTEKNAKACARFRQKQR